LTYIKVNGVLLSNANVTNANEASVISTNTTANTMTVDGGAWRTGWNQSQTWSTNLGGGPYASTFPEGDAFDGNPNTGALSAIVTDAVTYTGAFENVTSLKLRVRPVGMTDATIYTISGTGIVSIDVGGSEADKLVQLTVTQSTVSNITVALSSDPGNSSASSPGFSGIELNGKLLVDSSVTPTGETKVTGGTYQGTGTVVDVDVTNKQMLLSGVTSRWLEDYRAETLTEVDVAKLYAVMQENTGNIISLTSILPDFTDQVGQSPVTFNFPAVFPSGKTPAETFPFGTELCVDAKLSNPAGFDIELAEDSGACLQPGFKDTSGITAVSEIEVNEWNQSQVWGDNSTANGPIGPWTSAFDGGLSSVGGNPSENVTSTCTWTAIPATTIEIHAYRGPGGDLPVILNPNNGSGGFDVSSLITGTTGQWWNVSSLFTDSTFTGITLDRSGINDGNVYVNVSAIRVNGKLLVEPAFAPAPISTSSQLTFADNTNLNSFEASDDVYMCDINGDAASYTPQTSTIASVSSTEGQIYSSLDRSGDTMTPYRNPSFTNLFDGQTSSDVSWRGGVGAVSTLFELDVAQPISALGFYTTGSLDINFLLTDGDNTVTTVGASWSGSGAATFPADQLPATLKKIQVEQLVESQAWGFTAMYWDNVIMEDGKVVTNQSTLTFEDPNPDLQYFKEGDVVSLTTNNGNDVEVYTPAQEWSSYITPAEPASPAFDGNFETIGIHNLSQGYAYFTAPEVIPVNNEIIMKWNCSIKADGARVNGQVFGLSGSGWFVLSNNPESLNYNSTFANAISSVGGLISIQTRYEASQQSQFVAYIEIDGKVLVDSSLVDEVSIVSTDLDANTMTVDGGDWGAYNQSQVWSSLVQGTLNTADGLPATGMFNGVIGSGYQNGATPLTDTVASINFGSALATATSVTIYGNCLAATTANSVLKINGLSVDFPGSGDNNTTYPLSSGLQSIEWTYKSSPSSYIYIQGIEVDGTLLVDTSVTPTGKTQVTAPNALSGTGTFDSFTGTTADLATSNLEWVADNRLGQTFYMKSDQLTTFMQDNPEHVAIFNAFKAANDQYPLDVNSRRTSIASSLYRLMAGETLTAEETEVLTATVKTAVNATEPFALDGYYPLYYTAAAADAASAESDHHTHTLNGDTFYMPDGGTIYHGNYVE
jgi:hypothetical protein